MADRAGETVLVVFADLDGLKRINDHHGHAAGDETLRRAATLLRETVSGRPTSWPASAGTSSACSSRPGRAAKAGLDRLRDALAAQPTDVPPLALSPAWAEGSPGSTLEDHLSAGADTAMYSDKVQRSRRSPS